MTFSSTILERLPVVLNGASRGACLVSTGGRRAAPTERPFGFAAVRNSRDERAQRPSATTAWVGHTAMALAFSIFTQHDSGEASRTACWLLPAACSGGVPC